MNRRLFSIVVVALLVPAACEAQVVIRGNTTLGGNLVLAGQVTVTSSQNVSVFGTAVTFMAAVPADSASASGSATFYDGATALATVPLFSGSAEFTTQTLAVGTHSITVYFTSSGVSSAAVEQTVTMAVSSLQLVSSANPSALNQSVTFSAYVTPSLGTGMVTFYQDGVSMGTGTVNNGVATLTTSFSTAGSYAITASYPGDSNSSGSAAAPVDQEASSTLTQSSVTLAANPAPLVGAAPFTSWFAGQPITFTAVISPAPPDGEAVGFYDRSISFGSAPTIGGTATLSAYEPTVVAQRSITAYYPGDAQRSASTSNALVQGVGPYLSSLSLPQGPPRMGFVVNAIGLTNATGLPVRPSQATLVDANNNAIFNFNLIGSGASTLTVGVPATAAAGTGGSVIVTVNGINSNGVAFSVVSPFGCQ